jgi:hypothetical protein
VVDHGVDVRRALYLVYGSAAIIKWGGYAPPTSAMGIQSVAVYCSVLLHLLWQQLESCGQGVVAPGMPLFGNFIVCIT